MSRMVDKLRTDEGNDRLKIAIDELIAAVRANQSGEAETAALMGLVMQLRQANQNLVLASIRAQILQEEAEIRNQQQNEFLAMLAHELRNPIAPISNAASLLEKISSAHPVLPQIQGVISRQVEHMAHLIDDLLDASRITSGKVVLQKSNITINEIIQRSVELVKPSIERRHQNLTVEYAERPVLIEGDVVRLSQALSNLLVNASKYTAEGGHISLKASLLPGSVRFTVKDNGIGMEPDLLPHIFNLFIQGPRSLARSEGGLGIGLSVTKGLIELHGGQITARSDGSGKGSEFDIVLPVRGVATKVKPDLAHAQGTLSVNSCRILLVEDSVDTNATLKMILELDGHQVTSALDGMTGLALAKSGKFDLIICDIGLPGLDGHDVIRQVRQHTTKIRPFAIALSGYGQPEDEARALKAGFDEYLVKPVKSDLLLQMIAARITA